jgi:uncharacterized protein (DUF2062 family)
VSGWLRQGIEPQTLAFTLALGFAVGAMPVLGVATPLCVALAWALRLNHAAIQAANYAAYPVQLAMMAPFVRLGGWLFARVEGRELAPATLLHISARSVLPRLGALMTEAMLGWLVVAVPTVALVTLVLTPLMRRMPRMEHAEATE